MEPDPGSGQRFRPEIRGQMTQFAAQGPAVLPPEQDPGAVICSKKWGSKRVENDVVEETLHEVMWLSFNVRRGYKMKAWR